MPRPSPYTVPYSELMGTPTSEPQNHRSWLACGALIGAAVFATLALTQPSAPQALALSSTTAAPTHTRTTWTPVPPAALTGRLAATGAAAPLAAPASPRSDAVTDSPGTAAVGAPQTSPVALVMAALVAAAGAMAVALRALRTRTPEATPLFQIQTCGSQAPCVALATVMGDRDASAGATASSSSSGAAPLEVDVLIVGSGISGSCAAHHLFKNQGVKNLLLTERNDVVGGNVISKTDGEFVWEEGPNSFQPNAAICQTIYELGIADKLVLADASLPRFVYWEGYGAGKKLANLHALPTNLPGDLLTFNLLTIPGAIRAGLGAVGLIAPPPAEPYEESIREFVTRHLGAETFERVIDPFVSGVYAGDPDELAMRAALKKIHRLEGLGDLGPGLVSGAVNRFKEIAQEKKDNPPDPAWPTWKGGQLGSFREGLQTLPLAVEKELGPERVKCSWTLKKLEKEGEHYLATYDTPEGDRTVKALSVAMTAPTRVTSKICADLIPAAARLGEIYSPPVASVTMAYKKEWFKELPGAQPGKPLVGFGHLLPRKMGVRSLGTIWSSSLFPGRAPEGWELLLTYIGGARDKGIADMTEEEIYAQVDADNHQILLKPDAPKGKPLGCRVWGHAIPQYRRGHLDILAELERDEQNMPGLYLGGNYRTGVAFGDCVAYGIEEAEKIATFLGTKVKA